MITLPHSGLTVPYTDLRVTELREVEHLHGVSYTAVLQLGDRVVGVAENDGHGGDTTFEPVTADGSPTFTERDLEAFAAQCRVDDKPVVVSEVLDCLIDEFDLSRQVAKVTERGRTLARTVILGRYPLDVVEVAPPTSDEERDALIAQLATVDLPAEARWELWDGHRWTVLIQSPPREQTPHKRLL